MKSKAEAAADWHLARGLTSQRAVFGTSHAARGGGAFRVVFCEQSRPHHEGPVPRRPHPSPPHGAVGFPQAVVGADVQAAAGPRTHSRARAPAALAQPLTLAGLSVPLGAAVTRLPSESGRRGLVGDAGRRQVDVAEGEAWSGRLLGDSSGGRAVTSTPRILGSGRPCDRGGRGGGAGSDQSWTHMKGEVSRNW